MNEKELAEVRKTMAEICGSEECLFQDGDYPCPVDEEINGSNMCHYCKADYILNHIFTIEGGACPYGEDGLIKTWNEETQASIREKKCPTCKGTGKLPDKTFTIKEAIERMMK